MNGSALREQVVGLFATGSRRSVRIGVEHELLVADSAGRTVPVSVVESATRRTPCAAHLGFEPGGQLELSLPPVADASVLTGRVRADLGALRAACAAEGLHLTAAPTDRRPESEVPLRLSSARYVAMQQHFDTIGPAGRRMMRRTASTQVCLDWWPGPAGREQWRLLNLAGPFLAAALAREVGPDSRLATWLAVDPSRTAFDDRLVRGDDPVAAYADFAAGAAVFTTPGDIREHLSTLFPPVRPRGRYLEIRFPDVQEDHAIAPVATALATLVYDDAIRATALRRVDRDAPLLAEHWRGAAVGDPEVLGRGRELLELAGADRAGAA